MTDRDHHDQASSRAAANDRFKRSFNTWLWGSLLTATALHFAMFMFWPDMTAATVPAEPDPIHVVDIPDAIPLPPEPEPISRPAVPVITLDISEEITISPTTFRDNPVETLPDPREGEARTRLIDQPGFTPMTVPPRLTNEREVRRALEREYPSILRDAGIGGRVFVHFFIDEEGIVRNTLVAATSGHASLDEAALRVASVARFTPALNLDRLVPVWIQLPITFEVR